MNLRNEVCLLESAKRLKELEVKQESLYAYILSECGVINGEPYEDKIMLTHGEISNSPNKWSAFTSSELMSLLPNRITLKESEPFNSFTLYIKKSFVVVDGDIRNPKPTYIFNYECDSTACSGEEAWLRRQLIKPNIWDDNLSNAAAKTLIYLLENKLMEIKYDAKFTIHNGTCTITDSAAERS